VYGGFVDQCRKFDYWTENNPVSCRPYLSETAVYYMADTPFLDVESGLMAPIAETINSAFTDPKCVANLMSMICNSWFRECKEVESNVWLPSLMCHDTCVQIHDIWVDCVEDVKSDPVLLTAFEAQMFGLANVAHAIGKNFLFKGPTTKGYQPVFPASSDDLNPFRLFGCDVTGGNISDIAEADYATAFLLGRYPRNIPASEWTLAVDFPEGMDAVALYPDAIVNYTVPAGEKYEVPCFNSNQDYEVEVINCIAPYVSPLRAENAYKGCVKPCPSPAYSEVEYTTMWTVATSIALVGLILNIFMAATWALGGKKHFREQPFGMKACVFGGLLYGAVDTLPTLVLKFSLACESATEEGTGTSSICAINRLSMFILLSMQLSITNIVYNLYAKLVNGQFHVSTQRKNAVNWGCMAFPLFLSVVAYAVETEDVGVENGLLNVARTAFSCNMRFRNMASEWALLWVHFVWAGFASIIFSVLSYQEIHNLQKRVNDTMSEDEKCERTKAGNVDINSSKRRLLRIAIMCALCLLLNLVCTLLTSAKLDAWATDSDIWLQCSLFETKYSKNVVAYQLTDQQSICSPAEVTFSLSKLGCKGECAFHKCEDETQDVACFGKTNDAFLCATTESPRDSNDYTYCDCPCEHLIQVHRPSVLTLTLQYVAQSLVTSIVGINICFRSTKKASRCAFYHDLVYVCGFETWL
jgi:hypothetical protein